MKRSDYFICYDKYMKKVLDAVLIAGFLAVDLFFFHDFFKAGEIITLPQYLTGLLSVIVIILSAKSLLEDIHSSSATH
jgi:hypothetical protein